MCVCVCAVVRSVQRYDKELSGLLDPLVQYMRSIIDTKAIATGEETLAVKIPRSDLGEFVSRMSQQVS